MTKTGIIIVWFGVTLSTLGLIWLQIQLADNPGDHASKGELHALTVIHFLYFFMIPSLLLLETNRKKMILILVASAFSASLCLYNTLPKKELQFIYRILLDENTFFSKLEYAYLLFYPILIVYFMIAVVVLGTMLMLNIFEDSIK